MNRNAESHFAELPSVELDRSIFDRSHGHMTSFNVGDVIPFFVDPVYPGDTFRVTSSKVVRLQTMLTPTFSNVYLDTYYFFVPYRLCWTHFKEFMGENTESAWLPTTTYQIPSISSPTGGFATGTLADYFGLPVGVEWDNNAVNRPSALPFRAYALIMDTFFRSQNVTDPLNIPLGDANQTGTNGGSYINDVANGGKPFKAAKYFDLFTSCLPAPQKGPQVSLSVFESPYYGTNLPVRTKQNQLDESLLNPVALEWSGFPESAASGTVYNVLGVKNSDTHDTAYAGVQNVSSGQTAGNSIQPINLWADTSSLAAVTINELRLAFQLQKFFERAARSGTRYIEVLKGFFGVTSPDSRVQRPEYLGGNRIPLNVHEVTNSAQSTTDFLGDLGAKSVTSDIHEDFEKSFTEHGLVIGVMVARYDHSYSQGMEHFWTVRDRTSFYWPQFANIGEVGVQTCEICATAANMKDPDVFGYNEAWYDLRFKQDRTSGLMRPGVSGSLASWHLGDYYTTAPTLSDSWLREDKTNVDRVLAVTSAASDQIFADIYVKNIATRCLPMYSIPGLIDHH